MVDSKVAGIRVIKRLTDCDTDCFTFNKFCRQQWGVPRRQSHRRSGLATLPSVGAVP